MREHGRAPDKTSNVEKALWATRLAFEQRLCELPAVSVAALPGDVDETVRVVWDGFVLLVHCRWARVYGAPVVFDRNFAASWCSIPEWHAKEARFQLWRGSYMLRGEKHGLCYEWRPRLEAE